MKLNKDDIYGIAGSVAFHLFILLILGFTVLKTVVPDEDGGILVNFGNVNAAAGTFEPKYTGQEPPQETTPPPPPVPEPKVETPKEDLVTQEIEESVAIEEAKKKKEKEEIVETCLTNVGLWNEVKDALFKKGTFLSGGQQQRLCIARALALKPEVLLMDEPTSALDPIATNRIEELLLELKKEFTIIIVTHNMSQAARISDYSMFMYLGELIEYDKTRIMFTNPRDKRTEEYLTGQFG